MTFTFALGWWLAPTIVTIAAFIWHIWMNSEPSSNGAYEMIGNAVVWAFTALVAISVSLIAWLIWALLR